MALDKGYVPAAGEIDGARLADAIRQIHQNAASQDSLSSLSSSVSSLSTTVTSLSATVSALSLTAAFDNVAVNGGMEVSQELLTTGATLTNNTAKYIVDCFEAMYNHGAATAVVTSVQLAAASFPTVLSGFIFGHQIKATTAISSPANGDFAKHRTKIEGYRIAHLGWGAAGALAIAYAFRLYSTASGTAFAKFSNSNQTRCYYVELTVAAGWNYFSGTIAGDTSGTWQATTSAGLVFEVFVSGKAASPVAAGSWSATDTTQTTNSTNLLGTNNNLTILTGLYIVPGTTAPAQADLPKMMRPFAVEHALCLRYWEKSVGTGVAILTGGLAGYTKVYSGNVLNTVDYYQPSFRQEKRVAPTVTTYPFTTGTNTGRSSDGTGTDFAANSANIANATTGSFQVQNNSGGTLVAANGGMLFYWYADARL